MTVAQEILVRIPPLASLNQVNPLLVGHFQLLLSACCSILEDESYDPSLHTCKVVLDLAGSERKQLVSHTYSRCVLLMAGLITD